MVASFARIGIEIRLKMPSSVQTELSDVLRALSWLAASAPDSEAAELGTLQLTVRRLCRQLGAIPTQAKATVEELTRAG